jgi:hypothetical protein
MKELWLMQAPVVVTSKRNSDWILQLKWMVVTNRAQVILTYYFQNYVQFGINEIQIYTQKPWA